MVQRKQTLPYDSAFSFWPRFSADLINVVLSHAILPDPVTRAVRATGIYSDREVQFVPCLRKDTVVEEGFVPRPENIHILNLRKTVESLNDVNNPAQYRKRFYDHSPLPAAEWGIVNNNANSPRFPICSFRQIMILLTICKPTMTDSTQSRHSWQILMPSTYRHQ